MEKSESNDKRGVRVQSKEKRQGNAITSAERALHEWMGHQEGAAADLLYALHGERHANRLEVAEALPRARPSRSG